MKQVCFLIIVMLMVFAPGAYAQKKLTEATIYYDVVVNTASSSNNPRVADMLDGATSIIYVKGTLSRSDLISSLGSQSTIFDAKNSTATSIRDYGNKKFLITYTNAEWKANNRKYEGITYKIENEFKKIAGYKCQKATGKLANGTTFTVYFTRELVPAHPEFQYFNKNLPGLAMQYNASRGKDKVTFTVSNIEFSMVPLSKFDVPQTGYRTMSYTEFIRESSHRK